MNPGSVVAATLALLPLAAAAGDYVGVLKLPKTAIPAPGALYSFSSLPDSPLPAAAAALPERPMRLKLGYQYSRYFSVEGELNDVARAHGELFTAVDPSASPFRASSYGVDTVATLPVWRFSFYGRMGAFHGEPGFPFATYSTSLLGDAQSRNHWRYGLGVRYDFTSALGVRAQVERYSPLGSPLGTESDADLFSIGLSWRF
jgi:Outer membrane protein beta-barrel domain